MLTTERRAARLGAAGQMAELIGAHDWAATPLGPIAGWPPALRTAVEMMAASPMLASLAVGPERLFLYNDEAARHYGDRHPGALGRPLAQVFAHEFGTVAHLYDRAFAGESVHIPAQSLDPAKTGEAEVFDVYLTPVRDADGAVIAVFMTGFATTARQRAEASLRDSEQRFREFGEASQDVLWVRDATTLQWTYLSSAFETIYGESRKAALRGGTLRNWLELIVPEDREHALVCTRKVRGGERATFEYRIRRRSDGAIRCLRDTDFPIRDASGAVVRIGGVGSDITALKEATQHQNLLLAELQHRVRNILGMVRAMVRRSAERRDDVEDYVAHLVGRLDALARTQVLLTRANDARISLESLVREGLNAQVADERRVRIAGPDVYLSAKATENLTLVLHELSTNSIKYGALGNGGTLAVNWSQTERNGAAWLSLTWREHGVAAPEAPRRAGFGTELIEQRVPYELGGEAELAFTNDGIAAQIRFPLNAGRSILETGAGAVT